MKAIFRMASEMGKVELSILMDATMSVIGKLIKHMGLEFMLSEIL